MLIFLVIGLMAGVLSGLFGIGGGVLIVPALIYLGKMSTHTAVGTSLGALLLPVGLLGAFAYYRAGNLDPKASLLVALGIFFGAFFGAKISLHITGVHLTRAFALLLAVMAARLFAGTFGR